MNREIKFRVWDKQENCMEEVMNLTFRCGKIECCHYANGGGVYMFNGDEKVERYILMQYTGLKDKNGIEIYCGDIVEQIATKYIIKSCVGGFECLEIRDGKEQSTYSFNVLSSCCEVIGNIHETKEETCKQK